MVLRAVGLISPGDMGHVVGRVLIEHGMKVLTCLEGRSERTRMLARESEIGVVPTYVQLVQDVDMLLSIVVPGEAEKTAMTVAQALKDVGARIVYVDCNAIAPATVRKAGEVITKIGSRFVDVGIIGSPPVKPGITQFYASGKDAGQFEELKNYGLNVRVIGKEIGQASGLKMTYAALGKGTQAVSTELLVAAERMGLFEVLMELLQERNPDWCASMERRLPIMPTKSRRWVSEMEEIAKTFGDLGLTSKIYHGAADMYRFVGETSLAEETSETRDKSRTLAQVIENLAKMGRH